MNAPAILLLGQSSLMVAQQMKAILPQSELYGLQHRIQSDRVDVVYEHFGDTLRDLFAQNRPILGICSAGILIRTLAPLLNSKWKEPPVLAIAEDGSAVVPLLGGLHGVNDLARQIADALKIRPAITTTGDIRFRTTLLHPPKGYHLANPEMAKSFLSDLLGGETVKLEGSADWLQASKLPLNEQGKLTLQVTESLTGPSSTPSSTCLVYHPKTITLGCSASFPKDSEAAIAFVRQQLTAANLAPAAVAGVFGQVADAGHPGIHAVAQNLGVPARFFDTDLTSTAEIALKAAATGKLMGKLVEATSAFAIAVAPQPIDAEQLGQPQGQLFVIGTGPGCAEWMSREVQHMLRNATDWVGYSTYLNLVEPFRNGQQRHDSDNRQELDRAALALDLAAQGRSVAVISSGDPGIFAMAAAVFEALEQHAKPEWHQVQIQVAPGISAFQAAAARVGAPVGHDFCVISLSDILKPWTLIEQRLKAAAEADFVIALYNPVSKQRTQQLSLARDLLLQIRLPSTLVILARNIGRPGESIAVRTLQELSPEEVDMRTLVIIGSSKTRTVTSAYRSWIYTPRKYAPSNYEEVDSWG